MDSILVTDENTEPKLPTVAWIGQELLLGMVIWTVLSYWFVIFGFGDLEFGDQGRKLKIAEFAFDILFVIGGVAVYWASRTRRRNAHLFVAGLLLSVNLLVIVSFGAEPVAIEELEGGIVEVIVLALIIAPFIVIPFMVLPAIILFSSNVRSYFDPSPVSEDDDSSSTSNSPPPPPKFDD